MPMLLQSGSLKNLSLYMVGIKGTGMSALAELLVGEGARVSGSDTPEVFYTDDILRKNGIPVHEGFDPANLPEHADLVIYSAAYNPETHPELRRARSLGHTPLEYSAALAQYAAGQTLAAVSGVHGKTTTAAIIALIVRELGLAGRVLAGSALSNLGGSAVYNGGDNFFVAETCEYRRNFLAFNPRHLLITSVEADHLDYFKDAADVQAAFEELLAQVHADGSLVYCADDPGAAAVAKTRPGIAQIPYGFQADGDYAIESHELGRGEQHFTLRGYKDIPFTLRYPGTHAMLDAVAALALLARLTGKQGNPAFHQAMAGALAGYTGASRRSELIAEVAGIKIIDDYAHHPTAIQTTLAGYRQFFPGQRLIVDFMPHTYSRTTALLADFARCFEHADLLILNGIYASAREARPPGLTGRLLYDETRKHHPHVYYIDDFDKAAFFARHRLKNKDIFVTMGAGNNWQIGRKLLKLLEQNV